MVVLSNGEMNLCCSTSTGHCCFILFFKKRIVILTNFLIYVTILICITSNGFLVKDILEAAEASFKFILNKP